MVTVLTFAGPVMLASADSILLTSTDIVPTAHADDDATKEGEHSAAAASNDQLLAQLFPLPDSEAYGNVPAPSADASAQVQFAELVDGIIQAVRYIIGAVAILFIVYSGFRMVTGWGKEEVYQKARTSMLYAVIGLAAVGLAGEMRDIFSLGTPGKTFLQDPNQILRSTILFNQGTQIIITFIKYFIGGVAVLFIVRSGLRLITMGGAEDKIALDKKNLLYATIGLIMIIIADTAVNQVFYKVDLTRYPGAGGAEPAIDPVQGIKEIIGFTNFMVALVGPIAVLALLAGGVMYLTAAGEEEKMNKAKKLITMALIGIIIIYGAFSIVSTIVMGNFAANPPPV
jgi:cytochrome bd-type quinol oxidase subunit 2